MKMRPRQNRDTNSHVTCVFCLERRTLEKLSAPETQRLWETRWIFKWGAGACLSEFASCPGLSVLRCACDPNETICAQHRIAAARTKNTMLLVHPEAHQHKTYTSARSTLGSASPIEKCFAITAQSSLLANAPSAMYICLPLLYIPGLCIYIYIEGWSGDKLHDMPMNNWAWCWSMEAVPPSERLSLCEILAASCHWKYIQVKSWCVVLLYFLINTNNS